MGDEQETKRYNKKLPVKLTDQEKIDKGLRVVELLDEIDDVKEEAKDAAAEARDKIKDIQKRLDEHRKHLRAGTEPREVECIDQQDWSRKRVVTIRLDTGEIVTERALKPSELQTEIDDPEARELYSPGQGPSEPDPPVH